MNDLADQRRLEIDIDKLRVSADVKAVEMADEAKNLIRSKDLKKARELVDRGLALIAPTRLIDVMTTTGGMASRAQARRAVQAGAVMVDAKRATEVEMDVKHAKSIKIGGREILFGE